MMKHLLSAGDLTRDDAELVLTTAEELRSLADRPIKKLPALRGRTVVNLFFEDSTRTRISFEAAAKRLSADVINFAAKGSSVSKGESLKDTALTLEAMGADAIVIRHGSSGAPHRLANTGWTRSSVINAGDGTHEHPTQALLDAFTMWRHLGSLDGRRIALVGDVLHSRVARSNALLLRTLGAEVTLVAPPTLLPVGVEGWDVETSYDIDSVLPKADAVMMLRVQRERMNAVVLPDRPGVLPPLRPRLATHGEPAGARADHASRADGARHGDHRRRGRLPALGDRRAGHQRRRRTHGGALPPARRQRPGRYDDRGARRCPRRRPRRRTSDVPTLETPAPPIDGADL